jgi:hypothetical protein
LKQTHTYAGGSSSTIHIKSNNVDYVKLIL